MANDFTSQYLQRRQELMGGSPPKATKNTGKSGATQKDDFTSQYLKRRQELLSSGATGRQNVAAPNLAPARSTPSIFYTMRQSIPIPRTSTPSPSLPEAAPVTLDTGRGGGFGTGNTGGAALSKTPRARLNQAVQEGPESVGRFVLTEMARPFVDEVGNVLQRQDELNSAPAALAGTVVRGADQAAGAITSTLAAGEDLLLGALGQPDAEGPLQALNRRMQEGAQRNEAYFAPAFEEAGSIGNVLETFGIPTVAAIPQAALAFLTAGSSLGAQGTTAGLQAASTAAQSGLGTSILNGIRTMARQPNYWLSFAQGAGNDYYEAKERGESDLTALAYSTLTNLLNSAVEVGGGIDVLPRQLQSAAQSGKGAVLDWVKSMFDEGREEVIQGAITQLTQNVVLGAENPLYSGTDQNAVLSPSRAGQEFLGGAVAGGLLGAGQALVNSAINRNGGTRSSARAQESAMPVSQDTQAETAPQTTEMPVMEAEVQRLFGQQNAAPGGEAADVPLRERVRSSIPALQEMSPVSVLDGTEIPRGGRMIDRLVSFVNSIGNRVNRPGFGDVLFSRGRIKNSMIGHGVGQAKIDTFAAVPDVIRNGQQIDYQKNWKGRNYDTYTFAAPINYKGQETYLGVIVTKDSASNRYYLHEVVDADGNIIFTNNESPVSTSDGTSALAGDLDTVADTGDGAGDSLGTVDTVTDGRASQENSASVEGTRPLNSDSTIPQRADSVNDVMGREAARLFGAAPYEGGRVPQSTMTEGQIDRLAQEWEQGTAGLDAAGNAFRADPAEHIDRRTAESVGSRQVNAFQFDWPELHSYMQQAARDLLTDADVSLQMPQTRRMERTTGGRRYTQNITESQQLRSAMDMGLTRDQIITAAERLIADSGQENYAAAKRLELVLDDMLTNGYRTISGETVGPNQDYIQAKNRIAGAEPRAEAAEELPLGDVPNSVGAAARGFDPYSTQLREYGDIPEGENPARPIDVPLRTSPENRVSWTARTILEAAATPDSAVGDIGQAVVDGRFSYMPVSSETARQRAEATIRRKGWEDALADWRADVRAGRASEQITALGATLYNNAVNSGDTKAALDIAYDMSVAIRNGARATQAARILKTLTPSGILYMVQKEVNRLNEQNARRNVRVEDNVPVELWMQRVGENLADRLAARVNAPQQQIQTVTQTILSDLQRYANQTAPKRQRAGNNRTEMDRIMDLFQNRANYQEAWQAAKDTLSDTFENNPDALDVFDVWLESGLDYIAPLTEELTGQREIQIDEALADAYLNAETDEARNAALQAIYQNIADQMPANFRDKWNAWRYMAMLANPRTHVRNVLGNVGFQPLRITKNLVATAIESGLNAAGVNVERTHSFTAGKDLYRAAWKDYDNVAEVLGGTKYNDAQGEIANRRRIFRNSALEGIRRGNSRALELEDVLFKRVTYADTLANYLRANGVTAEQLQSGQVSGDLLDRARDYAAQEALRATYQDRNSFSNRVDKIARSFGVVGDAILPFRRTPANILVRGMEYSPAGLAKALTYDLYQVQRGNKTAAQAIDSIAAGLTGSALMALGAYLFSEGLVTTGGGDSEDDEWNDLLGHQSYALELPNGTSVTLDWLAPESLPFFMGVELASSMGENGMDAETIYAALRSVANPMLELSMLQSVNDLIDSVQYAEEAPLAAMIPSAVISYFSQAIPTLGGQIERTGEESRMSTYTDRNSSIPTDVQYALGRASSRIPGWDYQQTPYIDAWGREESSGSELERFVNNFFNPAYVSQVDIDEVESELQRIRDATGDTSVFPDRAARYFMVNGERKDLTAQEYDTYARALGQTRYDLVSEGMELPAYRDMSDGEKADYIGDLYEYANAAAKAEVSDYHLEGWIRNAAEAQREIGVSPAEYIALYEEYGSSLMTGSGYDKLKEAVENGLTIDEYAAYRDATAGLSGDKDEDGKTISGSKKEKVLSAIDGMDLSDEEKDWLYYLNGYAESGIDEAPWRRRR